MNNKTFKTFATKKYYSIKIIINKDNQIKLTKLNYDTFNLIIEQLKNQNYYDITK